MSASGWHVVSAAALGACWGTFGVVCVEVKLHTGERLLAEVFGGAYKRHRREVPQLVPGLHWRNAR